MTVPLPHQARPSPPDKGVAPLLQAWLDGADAVEQACRLRNDAIRSQDSADGRSVWIHLCDDQRWGAQLQLLQARVAESADRRATLAKYPLLGVPFAVKDNIDIAGEPTTAACPAFAHTAAASATVVQRLLDAGALWVGKTNLDQFATGLVGTRSPYGQPACVDDPQRISGGSSSGSAVAVARGWVAFALGTDTAGSGRIPAGFNGLVGLKPTPGRVSTAGVLPACRTLDCVSIFARTIDDAEHVLAVVEGPDERDPYSAFAPGPARPPARVRVGVPKVPRFRGDAGYDEAWNRALGVAKSLGWAVVDMEFTALDDVGALLYEGPWVAERHAVLQEWIERDPDALDDTVRRVVTRAANFSATDAFRSQYLLRERQRALHRIWADVDALLVPTAPGHPRFADVARDPVGENAALGIYTNFVNLLGWCALALPAGRASPGLPFGVTLIGPAQADAVLAGLGRHWESAVIPGASPEASVPDCPALPQARTPLTEPTLPIAVVGAHLQGLPLNAQLTERGATLLAATRTAAAYRLHALPRTSPPKPGLRRARRGETGVAIEVEVWSMPLSRVGSFLALIPAPLGLGSVELGDGSWVHGFLCETHALEDAPDISGFGGWRAYLRDLGAPAGAQPACSEPSARAIPSPAAADRAAPPAPAT
jgi:allophanate hydrolase